MWHGYGWLGIWSIRGRNIRKEGRMGIRFAATDETTFLRYIPLRHFRSREGEVHAFRSANALNIDTDQGVLEVDDGDYVIVGHDVYACKPDVFEQTYKEEF